MIALAIPLVIVTAIAVWLYLNVNAARSARDIAVFEANVAEDKLKRVLDSITDGFLTLDSDWVITYINRRGEQMFARSRENMIGRPILGVFPEGAGSKIHREMERARAEQTPAEFEALYAPGNRWFEVRGYPAADGGMTVYFRDVTKRKHNQQALALLADAGSDLASTLDYDSLISAVGGLAVPTLGDCCMLDVVEEEGVSRRIESTWAPELRGDAPTHLSRRVYGSEAPGAGLLHHGEPTLFTMVTDELLATLTAGKEGIEVLRNAGVRSVIIAPLKARSRHLGVFAIGTTQRVYDQNDVALVTEFSRRAALAADNALLYETARLANQAKSDFLAVVSHELRTPLTTVMGYTDLMLAQVSGTLSQQTHNYVERIRTAAWHLLGLIEQILIYARVEIGREQVHVERVPIDFVLRDAAALIEPVAAEKGLEFQLKSPPEAAYLDTDLTKLRQILLNLLSNAVKFTDDGEVTLDAVLMTDTVDFRVHDTGIGISPEHLEHIFDSFWQVDQSSTRRAGGTGLGLSVARKLARLLGGDVTATSTQQIGTTFTLTMPRAPRPMPKKSAQLDALPS